MHQDCLHYQARRLVFLYQVIESVQEVYCVHLSRIALPFSLDLILCVALLQALVDHVVLFV